MLCVSPSNAKMTHKKGKREEISDFEVLNVLFVGLEASPLALKSSIFCYLFFKKEFFLKIWILTNLDMDMDMDPDPMIVDPLQVRYLFGDNFFSFLI
jgi:hypothetical protein